MVRVDSRAEPRDPNKAGTGTLARLGPGKSKQEQGRSRAGVRQEQGRRSKKHTHK